MTDTPPPADDLVERLNKQVANYDEYGGDVLCLEARDAMEEAASEIARLRQKLEDAEAARDSAIDRAAFRARVYLMGCGLHYETADGATRAVLNLKEDAGAKDDWLAALTLAQSQRDALAKGLQQAALELNEAAAILSSDSPRTAKLFDVAAERARALASARAQAMGE